MKLRRIHLKLIVLAASCLAIGVGVSAITSAGAATSSTARSPSTSAASAYRRGARRALRRSVHGELVVATKSGFATITFDRGTVESVSGQQLTLREGTKTKTYKTVTLTIPTSARVRNNRQPATLSQLSQGERAVVIQLPKRTLVVAHTPKTP